MYGALLELVCPEHGLERFTIKIVTKYNIRPDGIVPKFRMRPKPEISALYIGKEVTEKDARDYLLTYLQQKGMFQYLTSFKII